MAGVIAGEACALIHDIPPAGEIVERTVAEAERLLEDASAVLLKRRFNS
jgi:nitronate monooxygenase